LNDNLINNERLSKQIEGFSSASETGKRIKEL